MKNYSLHTSTRLRERLPVPALWLSCAQHGHAAGRQTTKGGCMRAAGSSVQRWEMYSVKVQTLRDVWAWSRLRAPPGGGAHLALSVAGSKSWRYTKTSASVSEEATHRFTVTHPTISTSTCRGAPEAPPPPPPSSPLCSRPLIDLFVIDDSKNHIFDTFANCKQDSSSLPHHQVQLCCPPSLLTACCTGEHPAQLSQ